MAASKQWPEIEDLRLGEYPDKLFCCVCNKDFVSTTFVRTFRLARPELDNPPTGHSKILHRPLEHDIVLFDRHLECLIQSDIRYATISHVWDPTVPEGHDLGQEFARISGFQNVVAWPLGRTINALPEPDHRHPAITFLDEDVGHSNPMIRMQVIGAISNPHRRLHSKDRMTNFADEVSIVLQATGPDTKAFIKALGSRLYGENTNFIDQKLREDGNWDQLDSILQMLHDHEGGLHGLVLPIKGKPDFTQGLVEWLAEATTLSISNPRDRKVDATSDTVDLKSRSGTYHGSRMDYVEAHGGTIHMAFVELCCTISVFCPSCNGTYVFRAGLFEQPRDASEYPAYRIPSPPYYFSHADGVGLILRDRAIVGRMVWATLAYNCQKFESVQVKMPTLPWRGVVERELVKGAEERAQEQIPSWTLKSAEAVHQVFLLLQKLWI